MQNTDHAIFTLSFITSCNISFLFLCEKHALKVNSKRKSVFFNNNNDNRYLDTAFPIISSRLSSTANQITEEKMEFSWCELCPDTPVQIFLTSQNISGYIQDGCMNYL